jgi:hypothetical protein
MIHVRFQNGLVIPADFIVFHTDGTGITVFQGEKSFPFPCTDIAAIRPA